ncbi:hypothetical protein HG531_007490 [Fusarium graminearum]|nr:hypothetical protein HG531_007490 [Fusarium graminearum]
MAKWEVHISVGKLVVSVSHVHVLAVQSSAGFGAEIEECWNVGQTLGEAEGQFSRWVSITKEDIGDTVTRLITAVPSLDYSWHLIKPGHLLGCTSLHYNGRLGFKCEAWSGSKLDSDVVLLSLLKILAAKFLVRCCAEEGVTSDLLGAVVDDELVINIKVGSTTNNNTKLISGVFFDLKNTLKVGVPKVLQLGVVVVNKMHLAHASLAVRIRGLTTQKGAQLVRICADSVCGRTSKLLSDAIVWCNGIRKQTLFVLEEDDTLVSDLAEESCSLRSVEYLFGAVLWDARSCTLLNELEDLSGALINHMTPDFVTCSSKVKDITSPASRAGHLKIKTSFDGIGNAVGAVPVTHNQAFPSPFTSQHILEKLLTLTAGRSIDTIGSSTKASKKGVLADGLETTSPKG